MRTTLLSVMIAVTMATSAAPAGADAGPASPHPRDLGRQVLPENDGWAAAEGGTTGGAAATPENVHTVGTRAELRAALATGDVPKIIYVKGAVDANVDDDGSPITCDDYAVDGYSLEAYLAAYDPGVWGRDREPEGPLEDARVASHRNQRAHNDLLVPSNTTIVGAGRGATLTGFTLRIESADNVIVRNLHLADAADCFPQWDPTDGPDGAWNAGFDNTEISRSTHVWLDHNTFSDGDNPDSAQPIYFGRPYQVHDGLLDIVRGSNHVTVSWNRLENHDKVMLIGNTDSDRYDEADKLKVTLHHNFFDGLGQRTPRVRWGQVHAYNNRYTRADGANGYAYAYSLGIGKESKLVAEGNNFTGIPAEDVIADWGGTATTARDNLVDGRRVDLVAAYNEAHGGSLGSDAGWTPTLHRRIHPPQAVKRIVPVHAGAGRLRCSCKPHN